MRKKIENRVKNKSIGPIEISIDEIVIGIMIGETNILIGIMIEIDTFHLIITQKPKNPLLTLNIEKDILGGILIWVKGSS